MILHVDMDAFYASVEERDQPELAGQPLIVGGTPEGRGVVAAANYVVRKFGVHSAMPTATALRLCPQAIVLPPRMDYYAEVSGQIRTIFFRFTPLVEPLSLDEAFLDVSGSEAALRPGAGNRPPDQAGDPQRTRAGRFGGRRAQQVPGQDRQRSGKARRLRGRRAGPIQEFLDPLPVGRLWGVGRVAGVLERLGIRTIGQLRRSRWNCCGSTSASRGNTVGTGSRQGRPPCRARPGGPVDLARDDVCDGYRRPRRAAAWLLELAEQVARRLRRHELRGRTVQLKVRFADFITITRSHTLPQATNVTAEMWRAADELLTQRLPSRDDCRSGCWEWASAVSIARANSNVCCSMTQTPASNRSSMLWPMIRERSGRRTGRAATMLNGVRHRPQPRPGDSASHP